MSNETRTGRLHDLVAERLTDGQDVPALVNDVLPFIPYGDMQEWVRSGVQKVVRTYLRDRGVVPNHAARTEDQKASPTKVWVDFELEEVVVWLKHRLEQEADHEAATQAALEVWCEENPDAELTPDQIRAMAA